MTPRGIGGTLAPEDLRAGNWPEQSISGMSPWCLGVGLSLLLEVVDSPFVFL